MIISQYVYATTTRPRATSATATPTPVIVIARRLHLQSRAIVQRSPLVGSPLQVQLGPVHCAFRSRCCSLHRQPKRTHKRLSSELNLYLCPLYTSVDVTGARCSACSCRRFCFCPCFCFCSGLSSRSDTDRPTDRLGHKQRRTGATYNVDLRRIRYLLPSPRRRCC